VPGSLPQEEDRMKLPMKLPMTLWICPRKHNGDGEILTDFDMGDFCTPEECEVKDGDECWEADVQPCDARKAVLNWEEK